MSRYMPHFVIRLALVLAIAVGMVGTGFAHRTAAPMDADMLAFLEVGGTLDDLCTDGAPITHFGQRGCEACRLSDAAHMPTFVDAPVAFGQLCGTSFALAGFAAPVTTAHDPTHPARAPPVV